MGESTIDPAHVAATPAEFTELWDVRYPLEKTRIVRLLVKRVVYNGEPGGVQLVFHSTVCRIRDATPAVAVP